MQLTFIFIGVIGIMLVVYSIGIFIKSNKNKPVAEFSLNSEVNLIELNSTGFFSLCFIDVGYVNNSAKFNVELKSENGNLIKLRKTFPNYRFRYYGKPSLEYWIFEIKKEGTYTLTFKNWTGLIAKKSMLFSKRQLQKEINSEPLKILLKKTISTKKRFFLIISLVVGANALVWGILVGVTNFLE